MGDVSQDMSSCTLASWQIKDNPAREQLFVLRATAEKYKEHLTRFAGDKLIYFNIEELD